MQVRTIRKIHRWMGIVVGIQLLFWTGSGLFFALNPIERVRGETEKVDLPALPDGLVFVPPTQAIDELRQQRGEIEITAVILRPHLATAVYEIAYREGGLAGWALADPATGRLRSPVGRDEAVEIAMADFSGPVRLKSVTRLTMAEGGSEYRGKPLPAVRVELDHPLGTRIYVSEDRGVVTARRNDRWRLFDLFWMFHIMDYQERDDFNTIVLQAASTLGLITVLSGFVLAAVTSPRLRKWTRRTVGGE